MYAWGVSDDGVVLHLNDVEGRPRISLQIDEGGNPSVTMWSARNASAISFVLDDKRGNGISVSFPGTDVPGGIVGVAGPENDWTGNIEPAVTFIDSQGEPHVIGPPFVD